jgi:hypothetical protein
MANFFSKIFGKKNENPEDLNNPEEQQERQKTPPPPVQKVYNRYPLDKIVPVSQRMMFPGNFYLFRYYNWHHAPFPILFYMGTNPRLIL